MKMLLVSDTAPGGLRVALLTPHTVAQLTPANHASLARAGVECNGHYGLLWGLSPQFPRISDRLHAVSIDRRLLTTDVGIFAAVLVEGEFVGQGPRMWLRPPETGEVVRSCAPVSKFALAAVFAPGCSASPAECLDLLLECRGYLPH